MKREFYNIDGQILASCDCYVDTPYCAALAGKKYSVNYNRPLDTETVTFTEPVDAKKLQSHIKFLQSDLNIELDDMCRQTKDNRCGPKVQHSIYGCTNIFFHKKNGTGNSMASCKCRISMFNGTEDTMRGCAILAMLDKNDIQYNLIKDRSYQPLHVVDVYINSQPADKFWCIDNLYLAGVCAGCKWHKPWITGKYLFNRSIINMCPIDAEKCHARNLLKAGYTPYEAHVRCLACERAAKLKKEYSK